MPNCVICDAHYKGKGRALTCSSPCSKRLRLSRTYGWSIPVGHKVFIYREVRSRHTCLGVSGGTDLGVQTLCGRYLSSWRLSNMPVVECPVCKAEFERLYPTSKFGWVRP